MFWTSSIPRGGPRFARCMVLFGSAAECGWDPGTVSSSSAKPGKPSAGSETPGQNGWLGPSTGARILSFHPQALTGQNHRWTNDAASRAMTSLDAGRRCAAEASARGSPAAAWSPASGWAATAGRSSRPGLAAGPPPDSLSATSAGLTSSKGCSTWPALCYASAL